jgi:hypothetical protein
MIDGEYKVCVSQQFILFHFPAVTPGMLIMTFAFKKKDNIPISEKNNSFSVTNEVKYTASNVSLLRMIPLINILSMSAIPFKVQKQTSQATLLLNVYLMFNSTYSSHTHVSK